MKDKKLILKKTLSVLGILLLLLGGWLLFRALGFTDLSKESLQKALAAYGAAAPLIFILLSFLQVTFIPIPSTVTILGGAYLFGALPSFFYSYIGIVCGSLFAFFLGRVFGKRFVYWLSGDPQKVDSILMRSRNKEAVTVFFMFLFPMFPDDLISLIAGVLPIPFSVFLLMQLSTRITSIGCTLVFYSGELIPFEGWGIPIIVVATLLGILLFYVCFRHADLLAEKFDLFTDYVAAKIPTFLKGKPRKIFKLLLSRGLIFGLAILLQVATLVFLMARFIQYYAVIAILNTLLSLGIFIHLTEKDTDPGFKLVWLVILLLFPMLGAVLYLFLANPKVRKKQSRALSSIEKQRQTYLTADLAYRRAIEETLAEYGGIEKTLNRTAYSHGHLGNRVSYFGDGAAFFEDLFASLRAAESFIFLEYFIIKKGRIWDELHAILREKVREGVEVRLLYDDVGTLGDLPGDFDFILTQEGIKCRKFNPIRPILSGIYNYRDHRKIAVIDGKVAYTGGINIADEYAGLAEPFGKWKDSAISFRGSAVANFTFLFLQAYDTSGRAPAADEDYSRYFQSYREEATAGGYIHPFGGGPLPHYKEGAQQNNFLSMIASAKEYLYITTPYLVMDHTLETALKNAALRGVDVRIVTPHIPDKRVVFAMTRASYRGLLAAGIRIYEYTPGFLHAKQLLADGNLGFVGTINLDYRSFSHHFECGAVICRDPSLQAIRRDFDSLFKVSEEVTSENYRMNRFEVWIHRLFSLFAPLF